MSDPIMHPEDFEWLSCCPVCSVEQTWDHSLGHRTVFGGDIPVKGNKCGHLQPYGRLKATGRLHAKAHL